MDEPKISKRKHKRRIDGSVLGEEEIEGEEEEEG
jgi:hypothetical protein